MTDATSLSYPPDAPEFLNAPAGARSLFTDTPVVPVDPACGVVTALSHVESFSLLSHCSPNAPATLPARSVLYNDGSVNANATTNASGSSKPVSPLGDSHATLSAVPMHRMQQVSPTANPSEGHTFGGGGSEGLPKTHVAEEEVILTIRTGENFLSPSSASPLHISSGLLNVKEEREAYVPPRGYEPERLLYTGVFVGFLFRSYYVGMQFFKLHMPELRRGVGDPNSFLAAFLPTIGYDGGLDRQWMTFNRNWLPLFAMAAGLAAGTRLLHYGMRPKQLLTGPTDGASTRLRQLLARFTLSESLALRLQAHLYIVVGVLFLAIVHGPHFFLPLLLILANYAVFTRLQRSCPYWVFMALMWAAHVALLYTIERHAGFEDAYWLQYLAPSDAALATRVLGTAAAPRWRTHMRWFIAFRMTTLRLIAFNYDCWEAAHRAARARERAADRHDTACVECAQLREQNANANANANASRAAAAAVLPAEASRCYKYRTEHARDTADYGLANYLAYVVFPPLYLAGPMSSFNAFVSYMRVPSTAMPPRKMAVYAARTVSMFLIAYVHLHFWFIVALSERVDLLLNASPEFQSYVLYYYLAYLWLKFSFIWKSSRLFAMMSGIEVPEDMRRCFSNTTTVRNFWRDWHASFNLWIVRYMYVPLGGRARVALSIMPIFLFIALWHDPALHLLKWALCIAAMFVVELAVCACFSGVVDVFRRAGERAVEGEDRRGRLDDLRGPRGNGVRGGHTRAATCMTAWLNRLALWSRRRLTPHWRGTLYRELVTIGCFFSVFGLIVTNMIGFCVQNTEAEVRDRSSTDELILRALGKAHWRFYVGLFSILYSASGIGVSMWFWDDITTRQLQRKYGLRSTG